MSLILLQEPIVARREKLNDALRLQQFFRDVEDEEDWIREKEPIAASTNRGMYAEGFDPCLNNFEEL